MLALLLWGGGWIWDSLAATVGGGFPTDPILRIEGEMHTAIVRRLAIDPANQHLYSVSDDKTLRRWDLATGKLQKIFRVPIGLGSDGKLFALAISPDGRIAAVGGWTGWDWDRTACIYLLDLNQGRMISRIVGVSNIINRLVFSPDGRYLVAMLASRNGMRVFRISDGALVAQDSQYGDHSYWASFDRRGRLVTASYDGYVRLYDPRFNLAVKKRPTTRDRPYSVEFSPDGLLVAVGFQNTPQVQVLEARNLEPLYRPDVTGVTQKLHAVAWSLDGQYLYAAGLHEQGGKRVIRKWYGAGRPDSEGRGRYVDLVAAEDTIMHLVPTRQGGVAFAAADPAIGYFDEQGSLEYLNERPNAVFRGIGDGLRVSHDGMTVRFVYDPGNQNPGIFSVRNLALELGEGDATLKAPEMRSSEAVLTNWREGLRLNGEKVNLKNHEQPISVAFNSDGRFFLLGTTFYLRFMTREGTELWRYPAPATTWGVNISGDQRWGVAAFGDGTVRWFNLRTGREVLAFFPHNDRQRWVAWLTEGYYAASTGADQLVGWHKNGDRADLGNYYPVSQFNYVFHRPDLVKGSLK